MTECRRCSECRYSSHHWIYQPTDEDYREYAFDETYGCKHCDARGGECQYCEGDGCPICNNEGVVLKKGEQ